MLHNMVAPVIHYLSVNMWVFEEEIEGRKLTEIINTDHENVKYLPGVKLPANVVAVPDLVEAARTADLLVFVIPHQFIARTVQTLKGNIKQGAAAISLIKGINITGKTPSFLIWAFEESTCCVSIMSLIRKSGSRMVCFQGLECENCTERKLYCIFTRLIFQRVLTEFIGYQFLSMMCLYPFEKKIGQFRRTIITNKLRLICL